MNTPMRGKQVSKKQNISLQKAPRTVDDIETLGLEDNRKIDTRAKKKLMGRLRKTFKW
jgi:hypothetical protein